MHFSDYGLPIDNPNLAPRGPKFLKEPDETTILSKTSAAYLDCLADGNPKPEYRWYKGNRDTLTELETGPGKRFVMTGGRLTIDNPEDTDEGTYQCSATNKFGTIMSRPIDLSFGSEFWNQNRLLLFSVFLKIIVVVCLPTLAAAVEYCEGRSCGSLFGESPELLTVLTLKAGLCQNTAFCVSAVRIFLKFLPYWLCQWVAMQTLMEDVAN